MPYEECRPPNMNLIFTLTQPENFGAIDTWPNLISTLQISDNKVYIIYKGEDHHVCLIMFEDLCFIWKRTFKIMYARSATITALRLEDGDKQKFSDGQELFALVGFDNGTVEIHQIQSTSQTLFMNKVSHISFQNQTKPVVKMIYNNEKLFVCFTYGLVVLEDNIFKFKSKHQKLKVKNRALPEKYKHNFFLGEGQKIYLYNEMNGCLRYDYSQQSNSNQLKIQDGIKVMCEIPDQNGDIIAIGSTDSSLKIINYQQKLIQRFTGFKNYISTMAFERQTNLLWVGCLDGSISCFYFKDTGVIKEQEQFLIREEKIKNPSNQLLKDGISNVFIHGKLIIIKDIEHNIHFYDVIGEGITTQRTSLQEPMKSK